MGQVVKQTAWIYKGVTAVSIEEDIEIPASMFTIPEDVTVQEMDRTECRNSLTNRTGKDYS